MPSEDTPTPKVDINVALVSRLVTAQFPQWAHLPITPVILQGWDNRTFRLGEEMTVRLPSAEGYTPQVEKEHKWLPILAPRLPLPIPVPLARGAPAEGFPWNWSIYRWLEGDPARFARIDNLNEFAITLAHFLAGLQRIDPIGGPPPGLHSAFRGGSLETYDAETRRAIVVLEDKIDREAATALWEAALVASWNRPPVWFHGDVAAGNLLVRDGRLEAVIDFGCSGVGDPACDLTIAWTFLSGESREVFRLALPLDGATWARGRGWALWKGLITYVENLNTNLLEAEIARHTIAEILAEHKCGA